MGKNRSAPTDATDPADPPSVTLSTGQRVELPLVTEASMVGAVFSAPRRAVARLLPDRLRPVRATAGGRAAITLLSVDYRRVAVEGIDPYDEFGVVVPAVSGSTRTVPYLSALSRAASGYVWYLPVTTEPATALGVDVWGYPKVVADITHDDDGDRRRTTVDVDGKRVLALEVERPAATRRVSLDGYNFTYRDDRLLRVPTGVDADLGAWPFSDAVSVAFGDHDRGATLATLDLSDRALARFSIDGEAVFHPGERVPAK